MNVILWLLLWDLFYVIRYCLFISRIPSSTITLVAIYLIFIDGVRSLPWVSWCRLKKFISALPFVHINHKVIKCFSPDVIHSGCHYICSSFLYFLYIFLIMLLWSGGAASSTTVRHSSENSIPLVTLLHESCSSSSFFRRRVEFVLFVR